MTIGLSQLVSGPTHVEEHILDLVFCTGQDRGGLAVEELSVVVFMGRSLPGTGLGSLEP